MKKVNVVVDFRSKGRTFYKGEVRMLDDAEAERFRAAGWVTVDGAPAAAPDRAPKELQVQGSAHKHKELKNG
jgi:hypothetical protein